MCHTDSLSRSPVFSYGLDWQNRPNGVSRVGADMEMDGWAYVALSMSVPSLSSHVRVIAELQRASRWELSVMRHQSVEQNEKSTYARSAKSGLIQ
jgi:hypothetical protein